MPFFDLNGSQYKLGMGYDEYIYSIRQPVEIMVSTVSTSQTEAEHTIVYPCSDGEPVLGINPEDIGKE